MASASPNPPRTVAPLRAGGPRGRPARAGRATDEPLRVGYLDGLRGLAALYVVFAHALGINLPADGTGGGPLWTDAAIVSQLIEMLGTFSRYAVVLFIVLSGCSLMLPVVRSEKRQLPNGLADYLRRRARRILPPYYAALVLSLALIVAVPGMGDGTIHWWEGAHPALAPDVIASHLLLVHNWSPEWAYRINPPLWTIPIEWQIYFLFPVLLLPAWRRGGNAASVAVAFAVGLGVYLVVGVDRLVQSAPWFLGLFAVGMLAADVGFSSRHARRRARLPYGGMLAISLGGFGVLALGMFALGVRFELVGWIPDVLFGIASAVGIVWSARAARAFRPAIPVRFLASRPVAGLGWFSYSLYLVHAPILVGAALATRSLAADPLGYAVAVLIGIAAAVVAAYGFHVAFERPFMPAGRMHTERSGEDRGDRTASAA